MAVAFYGSTFHIPRSMARYTGKIVICYRYLNSVFFPPFYWTNFFFDTIFHWYMEKYRDQDVELNRGCMHFQWFELSIHRESTEYCFHPGVLFEIVYLCVLGVVVNLSHAILELGSIYIQSSELVAILNWYWTIWTH